MTDTPDGGALPLGPDNGGGPAGPSILHDPPVNPYCDCDPCRCAPPCTCGLQLVARTIDTAWDDEDGVLQYSVIETYAPIDDHARSS